MNLVATQPSPDFADWFSPILVKELRQGLKTRAFVSIFILVQVVMSLLVGLQMLSIANGAGYSTMSAYEGFFWALIWIPLLVVMPARGLTAVSEEIKANTLDLVQLTHLSSFRIVLGKWVALVSQTILLVAAILPYAVLRYFFGEVDVVQDMNHIGAMVAGSLVLTAGAVALSSQHLVVRILVLVMGLPMLLSGVMGLMLRSVMGRGSSSFINIDATWTILFAACLYIYLFLEVAASKIAPLSENHAARKRLLALALAVSVTLLAWLAGDDLFEAWIFIALPIMGFVILESMCERTVMLPSLYVPFARRGPLWRMAGRVLYPGWATGLVFFMMMTALMAVALYLKSKTSPPSSTDQVDKLALGMWLGFTAVVSPVVVLLFFPRVKQPLWLYLLVQLVFVLVFTVAAIIADSPGITLDAAYQWLAPFPSSAFLALVNHDSRELVDVFTKVTMPICLVVVAYLLFRMIKEFRLITQLEKASVSTDGK